MRLHICAVGRIRSGPERELINDYVGRFDRTARPLSLGPLSEREVDTRKAVSTEAEGAALLSYVPEGAHVVALDERGRQFTSPEFASLLEARRDAGAQDLVFVIGGADGLSRSVRNRADASLSLGRMVWPHMLARAMLSEQLFRAAGILAGTPYHRA